MDLTLSVNILIIKNYPEKYKNTNFQENSLNTLKDIELCPLFEKYFHCATMWLSFYLKLYSFNV